MKAVTEQEMRELDAWIAEHGFGLGVEKWNPRISPLCKGGVLFRVEPYSGNPDAFTRIKREIERRGWRWAGESHPSGWYWFRIWKEEATDDPLQMLVTMLGEGYEHSEELAGCLAFKAAVEASDS